MRRTGLLVALLGLFATGAAGCKDLHYYDVNVTFDAASFGNGGQVSTIEICHVYVTGADTGDFYVDKNCPPPMSGLTMGVFEYSSNADAGSLTFTMKAYNGIPEDTQCLFGMGAVTIPVGATTVNGELKVTNVGNGC